MNEIVNKFLLVGDTFMPEMHLKQPGFIYSACGPFTKHKERIERIMQTGSTNFIYKKIYFIYLFQKRKVFSFFRDNIWDVDLAEQI